MTIGKRMLQTTAGLVVLLGCLSSAHAQATRTWVSGVGDDVNPCSRTAPCKTFPGAISKTAAGGEINVLDPGGFGAVTITKAITISSEGFEAGVLVSGTNGIVVNAGANDVVVLRGLDIEGLGTGLHGISFLAGAALHVERCTINNFVGTSPSSGGGISFAPSGNSQLFVKDTIIRNNKGSNSGGILIKPSGAGTAKASLDNVRMGENQFGIRVEDNSKVTANNCVNAGNVNNGYLCFSASAASELNLFNCVASNNGAFGVVTTGANATLRISNCMITDNVTGIGIPSGTILSAGNNVNIGNTTNGAPSGPIPGNPQ